MSVFKQNAGTLFKVSKKLTMKTSDAVEKYLRSLRQREPTYDNLDRSYIPDLPYAQGPPADDIFAPRSFDEYIGQAKAKEICTIVVDAANMEDRPIPNLLIFGPYGLGKTTLSRLIMERHGKPYRFMDATFAAKRGFFKDYMIIDEIHNLPPEICDQLNTYLDQKQVYLIGCTTNPGTLPAPFRSRLRQIHLEDYSVEDIRDIVTNSIRRKNISTDSEAILELAKRSRYNPRGALQNLAFALEIMTVEREGMLSKESILKALDKSGIDEIGLRAIDRKYLSLLSATRPTGLSQICSVLGTDKETIETEIEPFLLREGLLERTPRGRMLGQLEDLTDLLAQSIEVHKATSEDSLLRS